MRICIVSKFPPTQGGIASRTYWRVRKLLDQGHEVILVTNSACTEPEYKIFNCEPHLLKICTRYKLEIHNLQESAPWHIPTSPDYFERLGSKLLEIIAEVHIDRIESDYLVPFGIAGHYASLVSGVPHWVRHGGSDIGKFLNNNQYRKLLLNALRQAECVITNDENARELREAGANVKVESFYEPDLNIFNPSPKIRDLDKSVWAYIGKINYHWHLKGLDRIIEWYKSQDQESVHLRIIGQGIGVNDFRNWAEQYIGCSIEIEPFVPPWEVPRLLSSIDTIFCFTDLDPNNNRSMIRAEAECMGINVISKLDT